MSKLFKKSKGTILLIYIFVNILVLLGFVYNKKVDDTEFSAIFLVLLLGILGLSTLLWFKQIARFDLKLDQMRPFRIPDTWISQKHLVLIYEISYLVIGTVLLLLAIGNIFSLSLRN